MKGINKIKEKIWNEEVKKIVLMFETNPHYNHFGIYFVDINIGDNNCFRKF